MSGTSSTKFSFASGSNANYIDLLYEQYCQNPDSVEASWQSFFRGYEFAQKSVSKASQGTVKDFEDEAKVEALINAYRRLGHLSARLDPISGGPELKENVKPEYHGLTEIDPKRVFHPSNLGIGESATFEDINQFLIDTYCRAIGADYREINHVEAVVWLQDQMESCRNCPEISKELKLRVFEKLVHTEGFERFLQDRYLGQKRFSIEGLDSMIPLLDVLADDASLAGVEELNLGMAHRGRLNVLANFMGKDYEQILKEFEGAEFNPLNIEGDVKYHKGFASEIETFSKRRIRLYLSPNPSHLEAVNPVVEGFARSRQNLVANGDRSKVVPVLIHGDAAVVGQGIVAETLNLSGLDAYSTGGTIHIVANNLIGFTAGQDETKSCDYASDVAKLIRAPVLHVNADDPEAVIWCAKLAVAYRQRFKKDFVIDLVGYRRHGHNETDEPGFTQPLLYKKIKQHPTVLKLYSEQLVKEGVLSLEKSKGSLKDFRASLQERLLKVRSGDYAANQPAPESLKASIKYVEVSYDDVKRQVDTAVDDAQLRSIAEKITNFPTSFSPHPKLKKLFDGRKSMLEGEGRIDWGMAELLAYASVAEQGHHVRLSGQDCRRGTFSHRHAVLRDFETDETLEILNQVSANQARVDVINSPLSEQGCLGFEFGYSVADPSALVLWEAQFGDFVNGAQIIIDQFLVASEAKWRQTSSLVLLLPHGYEGQGPEHSSARPERFLQSCGNLNIQVANCTTPAQLFHILRRQVVRSFQKPLVIFTPKSLLRHPKVISPISDFSEGHFVEVIGEQQLEQPQSVERVVMCTGKIYYDLFETREKNRGSSSHVPVIRVEQMYPFPGKQIEEELARYPKAKEIIWVQEEPANMGAWFYMRPRLEQIIGDKKVIKYVGRTGSGSTAEGSLKSHIREQQRIVNDALGLACTINPKAHAVSE